MPDILVSTALLVSIIAAPANGGIVVNKFPMENMEVCLASVKNAKQLTTDGPTDKTLGMQLFCVENDK